MRPRITPRAALQALVGLAGLTGLVYAAFRIPNDHNVIGWAVAGAALLVIDWRLDQ